MATKTASSTDRHRELATNLAAAEADVDQIRQRQHQHAGRLNGLRGQLLERSITHPQEFAETGQPAKGTAAKLAAEANTLANDDFGVLLHGAETRLVRASHELQAHVQHAGRQLLVEMVPDCEAAVREFQRWQSEGHAHLARLAQLQAEASAICTQSRVFDARQIRDPSDHWTRVVGEVSTGSPGVPLPLPLLDELREEDQNDG